MIGWLQDTSVIAVAALVVIVALAGALWLAEWAIARTPLVDPMRDRGDP